MKLPPLALQANVVYLLDDSCDRNQTNIGKTERHLATSVFLEFFSKFSHFLGIYLPACNHSTIENFHILSHGINDFYNIVKEALYIKKQKLILNKHLHQHGASFLLNVL